MPSPPSVAEVVAALQRVTVKPEQEVDALLGSLPQQTEEAKELRGKLQSSHEVFFGLHGTLSGSRGDISDVG
jgi:hypothetical protein